MRKAVEYRSPDKLLRLTVATDKKGDVWISFGINWGTHSEVLAFQTGLSPERAAAQFVESILESRSVIAVRRVSRRIGMFRFGYRIAEIRVLSGLAAALDSPVFDDELLELRLWNGQAVTTR